MLRQLFRTKINPRLNYFVQKRSFIINFSTTPNPESLAFTPEGVLVLPNGIKPLEFTDPRSAKMSPLAKMLFSIPHVKRVFLTSEFITITKDEDGEWDFLRPVIFGTITEFYSSGEPVISETVDLAPSDTEILETDSEEVKKIKEIIEFKVRPALEGDNGGIIYHGYVDGVVFVQLIGSCDGCSSSSITLKNGVERMLMHWIDGVKGLMAVDSEQEYKRLIGEDDTPPEKLNYVDTSNSAFVELEKKISSEQHKTTE
jgi:Fe-S cluster biogenesis protein NfuA